MLFFSSFFLSNTELENKRAEQTLPEGGLVPVVGGKMGEMVKEGKYGTNTVCICT
jgi:hypothetical protein